MSLQVRHAEWPAQAQPVLEIDDPRRELTIGTVWANSVDWDDAEDGSDGGYDRHGTFIPASAMVEIVLLRCACTLALDLIEVGYLIAEADRRRAAERIRALLDAGRIDGGGA